MDEIIATNPYDILWYLGCDAGHGDLPPLLYVVVVGLHDQGAGGHQDVKMQAGHQGRLRGEKGASKCGCLEIILTCLSGAIEKYFSS